MIVRAIVEFRPHAEGKLLHVRQVYLVMDVLQDEKGIIYTLCKIVKSASSAPLTDFACVDIAISELSMHPVRGED